MEYLKRAIFQKSHQFFNSYRYKLLKMFNQFYIFVLLAIINSIIALPVIDPQDLGNPEEENAGYFEGDMELTEEQMNGLTNPYQRNGLILEKYRWPGTLVFYEIDSTRKFNQEQIDLIKLAFNEIEKHTCLTFWQRPKTKKAFINITGNTGGCHSVVGYRGNVQNLNLTPNEIGQGCFKLGTIVHELIHALGFYHQQSASNRDNYVTIIKENIKKGREHNFNKQPRNVVTDFGVEYDYGSIMHYSAYAFSKNGKKTIIPHDKNAEIGQREGLSPKDIEKINLMYKCPKKY